MTHKQLALVLACCLSKSACAVMMDDQRVIEVSLSSQALTRVSVDQERIIDMFSYSSDPGIQVQIHETGHVFVRPGEQKAPLFLTVMTDQGKTQDLKLVFKETKAPAPLILRSKKMDPPRSLEKPIISGERQIPEILKSFLEGKVSRGFEERPVVREVRYGGSVEFVAEKTFENDRYRVVLLKGVNTTSSRVVLDKRELSRGQDLTLAFKQAALNPHEIGLVAILQEKSKSSQHGGNKHDF